MSVTYRHSIQWDWYQSNQSEIFFEEATHQLFNFCLENNEPWRNFTGLPLGLSYGILTAISQISLIAEQVFKGLGNILGCCVPDSDLFFDIGWNHLNSAAKNSIYLLVGIPIVGLRSLFIIPIMTFFSPDYIRESYATPFVPSAIRTEYTEQNSFNDNDVLTEFVF